MMIDIGQGAMTLGGSIVTAMAGVIVLILTNRAGFKKAHIERENARQDSMEQTAKIALDLARRTDEAAERLRTQAALDATAKGSQLTEIHQMVNSRLSEALGKINQLEAKIGSLESIINRLLGPGKALTVEQTEDLRQSMAESRAGLHRITDRRAPVKKPAVKKAVRKR